MRILVTGGAGFIGSHVVDALMADGHEVVVVDYLLDSVHANRPEQVNSGVEFLRVDLRDVRALQPVVRNVDAVSHHAAMVGLEPSFQDALRYVTHNDVGTAALLTALGAIGFTGRFVLASSMVVYGEGVYHCPAHAAVRPNQRRPEDLDAKRFDPLCPKCERVLQPEAVTEDEALDPRNVYAATKLHQEHLTRLFGRAHGAPVTIFRYHNVYGDRMPQNTPYAGVASIFSSALARGEPPRVFEDGAQLRDFVHAEDVARANLMALTGPEPVPGIFNIATGRPHSVGDMARVLADALAGPLPTLTGEWRAGDVRHVFASPARAHRELGWRARVSFDDGMRRFASRRAEMLSDPP